MLCEQHLAVGAVPRALRIADGAGAATRHEDGSREGSCTRREQPRSTGGPDDGGLHAERVYPDELEAEDETCFLSVFSCCFTIGAFGSSGASLRNFSYAAIATVLFPTCWAV